jgi:hypothetical protein
LERKAAIEAAEDKKDEEMDEAKQLNSLVNYARAVAVRDKQREELKVYFFSCI